MRQMVMDRWIEAAEARRVFQAMQELQTQPIVQMSPPSLLMAKLSSMVRPVISYWRCFLFS